MTRFRTAPSPQNVIIGVFLFLAAVALALAPVPVLVRSLCVLLLAYLAFSAGGMTFAYLIALLAPPLGLLSGDHAWLVMLPIVLSSGLLGMLGLEFAWRYPALAVSPLLVAMPPLVAWRLSLQRLFAVELPWGTSGASWTGLHLLVAAAGMLVALYMDRRRERQEDSLRV